MNGKALLPDLSASAAQAAEFLRLMANENRLAILCALGEGARSVGDLAEVLGASQPNVSQHLAKLKSLQLVAARREGTTILYSLASKDAAAIIAILHRRYCGDRPVRKRRAA
jgi:DNA-binding transcriptional ArsR family regulator